MTGRVLALALLNLGSLCFVYLLVSEKWGVRVGSQARAETQ